MPETLMSSPASPAPSPGSAPTAHAFACTWMALANVNTQAYANWLALCQEATARCALTRSLPEYMTIGSLMLPSCVSHAMQYCKNLSEVVQAGIPAGLPPPEARSGAASLDGKAHPDPANLAARMDGARPESLIDIRK